MLTSCTFADLSLINNWVILIKLQQKTRHDKKKYVSKIIQKLSLDIVDHWIYFPGLLIFKQVADIYLFPLSKYFFIFHTGPDLKFSSSRNV